MVWWTSGLIVASGLLAALLLFYQHGQTLEAGARLSGALAMIVDEQTSRSIQSVDQQLELAADALGDLERAGSLNAQSARTLLQQRAAALPFVRSIWTLDRQGRIQFDSDEGNIGVDLSDRDYFQVYRSRPGTGFYLGNPVRSRSLGTWLISAARPLAGSDGQFAGAIVAAIEPPYFDRLWQPIAKESGGAVSLLRSDGTILLRSPMDDNAIGRRFAADPLFTQHLPLAPVGVFRVASPVDGTARHIAYRTLAGRPDLVIVIGRSIDAILAPWRALAILVLAAWLVTSLAGLGLAQYFVRLTWQRRTAQDTSALMARRLTIATDTTGIVVWDWDLHNDHWQATPSYYGSLGYPIGDTSIDLDKWLDLLHADDRARVLALNDRIRSDPDTDYAFEARMRHHDGSYCWIHVRGQVVERELNGRPRRLVGVRTDVTELRQSQREREHIFNRITDGFVALDPQWRYTYVNQRAGELLQRAPESLIGKHAWTEFPPHQGEIFQRVCQQAMADQQPARLEAFDPEFGRWLEDHIYPSPQGLSIYFRDITQRKHDEAALRHAKEYAESLIAGANAMIVGLDLKGDITLFNKAAEQITGYALADLQGRNWFEVLVPRARFPEVWREFERLTSDGLPDRFENPVLTRSGEERLIAWRNSVVSIEGVATGTLSFGIDVTEQRRSEQALARSEKQLRDLIDGLGDTMFVVLTGTDGLLAEVNRAVIEATGLSAQQLLGMRLDAVPALAELSANQLLLRSAVARCAQGESMRFDLLSVVADGRTLALDVSANPLRDEHGRITRILFAASDVTDRKQAEIALHDSNEKLRQLTDNMREAFWLVDARSRAFLYMSPSCETVFGIRRDDLYRDRRLWRRAIHPDDLRGVLRAANEPDAQGRYEFECRIVRADGSWRWIHARGNAVLDANAIAVRYTGMAQDVTARRATETLLRESETRYRMLVEGSPYGISVHQDGLCVMVNPAALAIMRAPDAQAMLGQPIMDRIHPDFRAIAAQRINRMLNGERGLYPTQDRYLRLDGSSVDVHVTAAPFEFRGRPAVQIIALDITDRLRTEQALRESEQRFRTAFASSAIGMGLTAVNGRWLQVNQALCDIVGYTEQELLETDFQTITHPQDLDADLNRMRAMIDGEMPHFQMHKRYVHRQGHPVWVNLTVALVHDERGAPMYTVAQVEDISKQMALEGELRRSEARLKATFDALPDLLFEVDADGTIIDYHSPRTDLLLFAPGDFVGKRISDTMPRPAADVVHRAMREADTTGHSVGARYALASPAGERWFELSIARKQVVDLENTRFIVLARDVTERVLTESALRDSEERFREMAESVQEAFWLADVEQDRMLYVSPAYETITGRSAGSMLNDPAAWRDALHLQDRERVERQVDLEFHKGDYDLEYRIVRPDGQIRWIRSRAFPIRDASGGTYRIAGVMDDISARKRLQLQQEVERDMLEFLASSQSLPDTLERFVLGYESLLPGSRGSVLLMDADGVHIRHGSAPGLPQPFRAVIDGQPIGPEAGSCGTAAFTGQTVMVADIGTDPRWRDYRELALAHGLHACWSVPIRSSQGAVLGTFAFYFGAPRAASSAELAILERGAQLASQTIERHRAVQELRLSEARYRSLVEWTPLGIAVHQDGVLVYVNPATVEIFGARSADDLLGRCIFDLIVADQLADVHERVARILAGETMPSVVRRYYRLDGRVVELEGKGAPITIGGRPAVQISLRDVTAHNAAQAALHANAQQLRVLSARVLAAQETERRRVAHELHDELGQSLTAIKINLQAQYRRSPGAGADLHDENIRIVEQALQHVRGLALALRPSMLDDLGLVPALRWLAEQTASRNDLSVRFDANFGDRRLSPELETAVFRIVQEALTNVVRHAGARRVAVRLHADRSELEVRVVDDGAGFDVPAMQQRASQGRSLGVLGMVERATLAGATLVIESEPGKGCTVVLRVPAGETMPDK